MHNKLFYNAKENFLKPEIINKIIHQIMENGKIGSGQSNIPAGYTYLGQMIAHDIVPSTNITDNRDFMVRANLVLDSVYGDSEYRNKNKIINDKGEFIFSDLDCCCCSTKNCSECKDKDLLRNDSGVVIPDKRNDENIIISQMHLFWQKLHNVIISTYLPKLFCNTTMSKESRFRTTRNIVVNLFQQVIVEDYLYNIIDLDIYKAYMDNGIAKTIFELDDYYNTSRVPIEFSHAVFRFGHSMVRESYDLNSCSKDTISLTDLIIRDHSKKLNIKQVVEWRKFFGYHKKTPAQTALQIDEYIVKSMKNFPGHQADSIIKINIEAANKVKLASGKQIIDEIRGSFSKEAKLFNIEKGSGYDKITSAIISWIKCNLSELNDNGKNVTTINIDQLPLWLYILLEARISNGGNRLGKLGSIIVAETILMAAKQSRPSIFSIEEGSDKFASINRLNANFSCEVFGSDEIFNSMLDEFRRLTMLDLINLVEKNQI